MTLDLKRQLGTYQAPRGRFETVRMPAVQYLMVDGRGDPNTAPAYADALATIFPVAYALKFLSRAELARDYTVMPLEGLWWADDMDAFTVARDKSRWSWTLLNLVPDWITPELVTRACETVRLRGRGPLLDDLRLETLHEGLCVQTMHLGSYDEEGPLLASMHDQFIPGKGFRLAGRHHEIYLSDARRVAPEKLRTILRQPVRPVGD